MLASLWYKEQWHYINNLGVLVVFAGLFILLWPFDNKGVDRDYETFWGILFALTSSIFNAMANVMIQEIREESTLVIGWYSMTLCALFSSIALGISEFPSRGLLSFQWESLYVWMLMATGGLSLVAQNLKHYSLQTTQHLGILLFKHLDILFSLLWDHVVLKESIAPKEIYAILLILVGCCIKKY